MPKNKNAMVRYRALDKCLSNHSGLYYIENLVEACCQALRDECGDGSGVSKRQVYADLKFIEREWRVEIERLWDGQRKYFRYEDLDFSISNQPLSDEEMSRLKETIYMLNRFKGMPQFEWMEQLLSQLEDRFSLKGQSKSVIGFEQNLDYTASRHLSNLFNYIVNRQPLRLSYRKFDGTERIWVIHPYYLKQYNNRWFLFGLNDHIGTITNIPLDRIENFTPVGIQYKENNDIDFDEYFDDVIGVTIKAGPVLPILLRFSENRFPYIESKPLHMSMKIKNREKGIVEISVIPNNELDALICSYGCDVEVLSPTAYRDHIKEKVHKLHKFYFTND